MHFLLKLFYRRAIRRASHQILMGRLIDRDRPERGRFLEPDVDAILERTWHNMAEMLPVAELWRIPTLGSRHNVFLTVLTVAGYHAYLAEGIERQYAIELFADVGWKLYVRFLKLPRLLARLITRDPQKQINLILRVLLLFPFRAPGKPGYEVLAWAEGGRFCTDWTHCPPLEFVKRYVEKEGDRGELEAFHKSWCWYDWAFTYAMVGGGYQKLGHYERPHTMSLGDEVCDMRWYGTPQEIDCNKTREGGVAQDGGDSTAR